VLWQITEALVRLVAPIMSFTADEVWEYLPPVEGREASVHLARFPKPEDIFSEDPASVLEEWRTFLFYVRSEAMRVLEEDRQAKIIGKGLDAQLRIETSGSSLARLERYKDGLKEFLNVSSVTIAEGKEERVKITASPAPGKKCARCWNFMPDTADYGIWQNVCGRCRSALHEMGIAPPTPEAAQ